MMTNTIGGKPIGWLSVVVVNTSLLMLKRLKNQMYVTTVMAGKKCIQNMFHTQGLLKPIETSWDFPSNVLRIYRETVKAINAECYTLAAAGFRAVIESICLDKQISGKTLETKINNMKKAGIITMEDRDRLHSVRFLGNDSVHEIKTPERRTLLVVLEIIEGILKSLYIYEEKISSELERPIKTIEEFIALLNEGIANKAVGNVYVLRNLLPENRRLIREDLNKFEQGLIDLINNGKYNKLALCPTPTQGRHQQYKVING